MHAGDPVGGAGPFDGLDDSVRGERGDAQAFGGVEESLMMRTVDLGVGCAAVEVGQARIGFEARGVMRLGRAAGAIAPGVLDGRLVFAGDVLNQRAAQENVQALDAIADAEDRFVFREGVAEDGEVGLLALGVGGSGLLVARGVIELRIDIGGAARENVGVEGFD